MRALLERETARPRRERGNPRLVSQDRWRSVGSLLVGGSSPSASLSAYPLEQLLSRSEAGEAEALARL